MIYISLVKLTLWGNNDCLRHFETKVLLQYIDIYQGAIKH